MSADHVVLPVRHAPGPSMLPMPISRMGAWYFWARPDAVGLSADDAVAIRSGVATPEQVGHAEVAAAEAFMALRDAEPPQPHGLPS